MKVKEEYVGAECSGSDGGANRTITLKNTKETSDSDFLVFVNNSFRHLNSNYTVSHNESGSVITFLDYLWDDQHITIIYSVSSDQTDYLTIVATEESTGSDCTGSDGDSNRTLTLSNTTLTYQEGFLVYAGTSYLHLNIDYSVSHSSSGTVITFLNALFDSQDITVNYYVKSTSVAGGMGVLPLETQYINNEINYFGDTVRLKAQSKLDEDNYGNAQAVWGDSKVSYTSGDDALTSFYDSTWIAQTFTVGDDAINTSAIKIKIKRTGTPGAITIGIRAVDGDNKPYGSDLVSETLDYTDLIDDGSTKWIVLPLDDYTLNASTTYALVIRSSGGDSSNKYESRMKTTGTYSGGNILTSSDSGSSWTAGSSDILFDLYGDSTTVAMVDILTMDDDVVKSGQFQSGDIRLNFQNSETNIVRGTKVKYRDLWFEIDAIEKDSLNDITYFNEAIAHKI